MVGVPEGRRQTHQRAVRPRWRHGHQRHPGHRGGGLQAGSGHPVISIDGVKGAFEAIIAEAQRHGRMQSPARAPAHGGGKGVVAGKPLPQRIVTETPFSRWRRRARFAHPQICEVRRQAMEEQAACALRAHPISAPARAFGPAGCGLYRAPGKSTR